jgi:hypothetical protein
MKIRPVGAKLSHLDRQTDRHGEDNSRFSQFCRGASDFHGKNTGYGEYIPASISI